MNRFTLFIAAASLAANAIYADNSQPAPIIKKITSEQLSAISQSPTSTQPPADLGGNFSSWELLREIGGMRRDFVCYDALANVGEGRERKMFLRGHIAYHCGAEP